MWAALVSVLALGLALGGPRDGLAQGASKQQVVELMMLSGANRALERVTDLYLPMLELSRDKMPQAVHKGLKNLMLRAFDPRRLNAQYVAALQAGLDEKLLMASSEWLKSPLGLRLTRLEVEASTEEGRKRMETWSKRLGGIPPLRTRFELMLRLVHATNGAVVAAETEVIVKEPIIQTLNATAPEKERQTPERMFAKLVKMRDELLDKKAQLLVTQMLYTYRDVSDDELRRYVVFLESQTGRQYTDRANAAMLAALRESNDWIAARFHQLF